MKYTIKNMYEYIVYEYTYQQRISTVYYLLSTAHLKYFSIRQAI